MKTNFTSIILTSCVASLSFWTATSTAAIVTYEYTATIATVSGTPFGYTSEQARTQPVTGFFSYDTSTPDVNIGDTTRGYYPHTLGGGGFRASFLSTVVTGSATPHVRIENLSSDTFRFYDGITSNPAGGMMLVNGSPDGAVRVGTGFTTSNAFTSDALPLDLGFPNPVTFPHTFAIVDSDLDGGTLLLQMSTFNQVPEPSVAALAALGLFTLFARRRRGEA